MFRWGDAGALTALTVAGVTAAGVAVVDRLVRDVHARERDRELMLEQVLDELRSRATAVTLAVGMFRRRWEGRGSGGAPHEKAQEVVGDTTGGRPGVPQPIVVAVRDETRLREQALATLEAEAELLRVGALELAAWLRFEAGRVAGERERVDLAALAERCSRRLAMAALARQVQLRYRGAAGPATVVLGDRTLLELLCLTLVAAAVDRALPGSSVQVDVWSDGGGVGLEVTGEAPGMRRAGGRGWQRPGTAPEIRVDLARRIARLHGGDWCAMADHPLRWRVLLPAAHGPFSGFRLLPFPGPGGAQAGGRRAGRHAAVRPPAVGARGRCGV
ncbi:MAG TPA: hypothetical protein VIK92_04685 [Thermaerobacter sp.]